MLENFKLFHIPPRHTVLLHFINVCKECKVDSFQGKFYSSQNIYLQGAQMHTPHCKVIMENNILLYNNEFWIILQNFKAFYNLHAKQNLQVCLYSIILVQIYTCRICMSILAMHQKMHTIALYCRITAISVMIFSPQ